MSERTETAFIALGANLDNPERQLLRAIESLNKLPQTRLIKASSLYRTAPLGVGPQPAYINAVAAIDTALTASNLLKSLQALEAAAGRQREAIGAPRTLDLDLLLYGNKRHAAPTLQLPHPRMHLRAFVLAPLLEIAPDIQIPERGSAAAWLPAVAMQDIECLGAVPQ